MDVFVIMLGIHCGLNYASSKTAIGVSLGSVFFLFLGVVTLILFMISFSGSFQTQLAPFLAFIVGGSVGLFVTLGSRNPSAAIGLASLLLPFATFFAITNFLVDHLLEAFLVTSAHLRLHHRRHARARPLRIRRRHGPSEAGGRGVDSEPQTWQ